MESDDGNPTSRRRLLEFERTIGAELPNEYREYIIRAGDAPMAPLFIDFDGVDGIKNSTVFRSLFRLDSSAESLECNYNFYVGNGRIEPKYVPIAEDIGGNILCIGLTDDARGNIYLWDHELEAEQEGGVVALVCGSFNDFLSASRAEN